MPDPIRTLADLQEELTPKGEKIEKDAIENERLIIERATFWEGDNGPAVFVVALVISTGERVNFNAGKGVIRIIEDFEDYLPFEATLKKVETRAGREMWVLE